MNQQHLISTITQRMELLPTPYALLQPDTLGVAFMNEAFREMLPAGMKERANALFTGADHPARAALRQMLEDKTETHFIHPQLGARLQFSALLDGEQLLGVQCFALHAGSYAQPPPLQAQDLPEELAQHIEKIPAHIWLCRPNGEVFWISESLKDYLYGEAALGSLSDGRWIEAIHPADITRTNAWFLQFMIKPSALGVDFRLSRHDGDLQWFHASARVVRDTQGQIRYVIGTNINIDVFKQREQAQALEREQLRKEYEANLGQTLAVQQQLAQNQKRELLESIAGGVAHDLNNLLFVINLNSNLLKKRVQDEKAQGYLEVIHKTVKRANRLASQLISFSGRKSQSMQPTSASAVVEDIEELLLNAVGAEVDFTLEIAPDLGTIEVDINYFENALLNLAINARDAVHGRGKVWLKIYNQRVHHSNGTARNYVTVEVGDSGSGMSDDVQRRIFDPFYTTKDVGKGNGLGLPMVQGFVRQCDGFIEVRSELGRGTQFFIYLPHSEQEVQTLQSPEQQTAAGGAESVLIVEDDVAVRDSLALALQELGYQVATAFNADVALKYIRSGMHADIVISDLRMPGELKATEMLAILESENYRIPVLLTTGYSGDVLIEDGLVNHQYHVLFKPFSMDELGTKVREILDQR